jgi:ActR/RegA family two-component response regulator
LAARIPIFPVINKGYEILEAEILSHAMATLQDHLPDILLLDFNLPDGHGLDLPRKLSATKPRPQVLVVTGTASISTAVYALQLGAIDLADLPAEFSAYREEITFGKGKVTG